MEKNEECQQLAPLAQRVASSAHRGQVDKAGRDYIEHPRRVATKARVIAMRAKVSKDGVEAAVAAAWLHDVLEETTTGEADLRTDFPSDVVDAVMAVTKRSGEPPEDYFSRVRANRIAVIVKTADLVDNTDPARQALLDEETQARLGEKYRRAYDLLGVDPNTHDGISGS